MEPDSLSFGQRLVKSIKWLVMFVLVLAYFKPGSGGQEPSAALGFLVCIPLYIAIYRVLYGNVEELFGDIGFVFTPDILSLMFGELLRDWARSAKVGVLIVLCVLCATAINSYYSHSYELTKLL